MKAQPVFRIDRDAQVWVITGKDKKGQDLRVEAEQLIVVGNVGPRFPIYAEIVSAWGVPQDQVDGLPVSTLQSLGIGPSRSQRQFAQRSKFLLQSDGSVQRVTSNACA